MITSQFRWHAYRYFPYEKKLAVQELKAFGGMVVSETEEGVSVEVGPEWEAWASRLTYFSEAYSLSAGHVIPTQALLESSANGDPPASGVPPRATKQNTRYSAHGLHEYRGKFNPQIVRAIGNILRLRPHSWILDPFCGSGTTLLEAVHNSWNAVGVDTNPLAIEIASAKIASMHHPVTTLVRDSDLVCRRLLERAHNQVQSNPPLIDSDFVGWSDYIGPEEYAKSWFTEPVLSQVAIVLEEISRVKSKSVRLVLRVMLSDILRDVSLQDGDDLRIRRRKEPTQDVNVITRFVDSVVPKIRRIASARAVLGPVDTEQHALLGDARSLPNAIRPVMSSGESPSFNAVITSPPYATALPYIDTNRLSLVVLGLAAPADLRKIEQSMIGTREIRNSERIAIENSLLSNASHLPATCHEFCLTLYESLDNDTDGFRRMNQPALIYKYLADMAEVFRSARVVLGRQSYFAFVVGENSTKLGGKLFRIDTPSLLTSIGLEFSYSLYETVRMDTYQRYDIHKSNSIKSETLVILRAE